MVQARKSRPLTPRQAARRKCAVDGLLAPDLFKALGDPTRVQLLSCLMKCGRPCAVSEIAACCSVDLSVVSRHLHILERTGILESTKTGRTVLYSVRFARLCEMLRELAAAIESCCPADAGGSCGTGGCCDAK